MSVSTLYGNDQSVTKNSKLSARNQQAYDKLAQMETNQRDRLIADEARKFGIAEGVDASGSHIRQLIADNNQYRTIVEGSRRDIQMQNDVNRGLNYEDDGSYDLVNEVNAAIPASPQYREQAAAAENELIEDAQNSAFTRAQQMGDTSEDNMNTLLIQELNSRGIQ